MTLYATDANQWRDDTIRTCRFIPPHLLAAERDLMPKKWFAYRFATPWQATQHFADLYREGFRNYNRYHRDREAAETCKGLPLRIFSQASGTLTQLWMARQRADELGLPYELLIEFGFDFAGRRKRRMSPAPLQLFPSDNAGPAWAAELEKFLETRLPAALARLDEAPQYRIEHYQALPMQDEFRAHIVDYVLNGPGNWATKVGAVCVRERFLPLEAGIDLVPEGQRASVRSDIERDEELGMLPSVPKVELKPLSFTPTCFGIPGARNASSELCAKCPVSDRCSNVGRAVAAELINKDGSVSPVKHAQDETRKASQNERQARRRARLRAEAAQELSV